MIDAAIIASAMSSVDCSSEQIAGVLAAIAETSRAVSGAERTRKWRENQKARAAISDAGAVTVTQVTSQNVTELPVLSRARVLNLVEIEDIKEVLTEPPKATTENDLFGSSSKANLRKSKIEADTKLVQFVAGKWNEMAERFPRMVRIEIVGDRSHREKTILARSREMVSEWGFASPETGWTTFFEKIVESQFLRGDAPPGPGRDHSFRPKIDKLLGPQFFTNILEGAYGPEVSCKPPNHGNGRYANAFR